GRRSAWRSTRVRLSKAANRSENSEPESRATLSGSPDSGPERPAPRTEAEDMKKLLFVAIAAAAFLIPRAVLAHHGWGGYLDAEFEVSGTVAVPVSLAGPHA